MGPGFTSGEDFDLAAWGLRDTPRLQGGWLRFRTQKGQMV